MKYRRLRVDGGMYFFTLVTHLRKPLFGIHENVGILKYAFKKVMESMPYRIVAIAIMPDHLHCIWQLPENDSDYSTRWRLIKTDVTKAIRSKSDSGTKVWQSRYWEHLIRDEDDYKNHLDYIHYNPVKHGLVKYAVEWEHSSFRNFHKLGIYSESWGASGILLPDDVGFE